jgi:hypothetical protein
MANPGPAVTTGSNASFVGSDVIVGLEGAKVGFYGTEPVVQPTSASITDYATLKAALQALGLIGS